MRIVLLFVITGFISCVSAKHSVTGAEKSFLEKIVSEKKFEVVFDNANPLAVNRLIALEGLLPPGSNAASINLVGNSNYFRVEKDSLSMYIPYYGEQQIARGYNEDPGIKFNGKPTKTAITYNSKKEAYIIKYWAKSAIENYMLTLTLYANKSAFLSVNSSHRTNINYNGSWKELPDNLNEK